jgi:sec-independent protein translocase protein TatA
MGKAVVIDVVRARFSFDSAGGRRYNEPLCEKLIVFIIFGRGKLPESGEGLGKSIKEFKKAIKDEQQAVSLDQNREKNITSLSVFPGRTCKRGIAAGMRVFGSCLFTFLR